MIEKVLDNEVQQLIKKHEQADLHKLALSLKPAKGVSVAELLQQINGIKKAREKLPEWYANEGLIWPRAISMEQCSSEITAKYKASLVSGDSLIDLTGGAGVDTYYFSRRFNQVDYVERDTDLYHIASHNHKALGAGLIRHHHEEAEQFLAQAEPVDVIYLDPARRDSSKKKVFLLEESQPDVITLLPSLLHKAEYVLIKTSPMLDVHYTLKSLKDVSAVHVVAVNNECKEVLYLLQRKCMNAPDIYTVNFSKKQTQTFKFNEEEEGSAEPTYSDLLNYLYEPNSAILKAGAFKSISSAYKLNKLHKHTHLYTSDHLIANFPGRVFKVNMVLNVDKKKVREHLPEGKANVAVRNFPLKPDVLKKKLGLTDGGTTYLFGFTGGKDIKRIALTEKVN